MQNARDWDEGYIVNLPIGEQNWFEVKGRLVIKPESKEVDRDLLSKAISAFSNSGGGILILGVKQSGKLWEVDDGGIETTIRKTTTREWLEDIIPVLVDPPLKTFNVYEIKKNTENSQIESEKAVYVIQIEDSHFAPHQASDNKYYGRIGGKSRPLSHRMITDIFNRRQHPILEINFFYAYVDEEIPVHPKKQGKHPVLVICVRNTGSLLAQFVNSILIVPDSIIDVSFIETFYQGTPASIENFKKCHRIIQENVAKIMDGSGNYSVPVSGRYDPILPGRTHIWMLLLRYDIYESDDFYMNKLPLFWELYSDNSPVQKGEILLNRIPLLKEIRELW